MEKVISVQKLLLKPKTQSFWFDEWSVLYSSIMRGTLKNLSARWKLMALHVSMSTGFAVDWRVSFKILVQAISVDMEYVLLPPVIYHKKGLNDTERTFNVAVHYVLLHSQFLPVFQLLSNSARDNSWINHAEGRSSLQKAKQVKVFQKDAAVMEMMLQSALCYCWFADIPKCVPKLYLK